MSRGHAIFLRPGSQRNFRDGAERDEFCSMRYEHGQRSLVGSTAIIDVDKATRWHDGCWMIWGWLTEVKP